MPFEVNERTSAVYTATLRDAAGDPVPASALSSLTGWVRDVASGTYLVEAEDLSDGLHATSGLFTWPFAPDDNAIVGDQSGMPCSEPGMPIVSKPVRNGC